MTDTATFSGFPVDVWEEGMQAAEKELLRTFPDAQFRGFVQEGDDLKPCAIIPAKEMSLVLTSAEWGAIRWLLTEQATMMWTVSRQLMKTNPDLALQAEWWKDLEERVSSAIEEFAPIGPLHTIVSQGMEETR